MRVIIGGAGRVGSELARAMRAETMDVVLIDNDSRAVKNAQSLDALVIHGDITSRRSLQEAGIGEASVFVAVPDSDDRNLIACALAEDEFKSKNGSSVQHNLLSIGRFRDRNYVDEHHQGHLSTTWAATMIYPSTAILSGLLHGHPQCRRRCWCPHRLPCPESLFLQGFSKVSGKPSGSLFSCKRPLRHRLVL